MLIRLSLRNIVLIEALDLEIGPGLGVLTGETGAGKSILLDGLALVLGGRGAAGLVRAGAAQATVTAEFALTPGSAAHGQLLATLAEQGLDHAELEAGGPLILRRQITGDGRSRAFVNDQAVSVGLLRSLAEPLIEIHGQFEAIGLFRPAVQRDLLDAFGGLAQARQAVRDAARQLTQARDALEAARAALSQAAATRELLEANLAELRALAPRPGEEAELAAERTRLQHRETLAAGVTVAGEALEGDGGAQAGLAAAQRALARITDRLPAAAAPPALGAVLAALDRAEAELAEAASGLHQLGADLEGDGTAALEALEERLFALRDAARKHGVAVDRLAETAAALATQLEALNAGDAHLATLADAVSLAQGRWRDAAAALTRGRQAAAARLDQAVMAELAPLRLERARFQTTLLPLEGDRVSETGAEEVQFLVATNPGQPAGPLSRIASGGELSRFLLALKVALAGVSGAATLVFDEVDAGIGGATADAVGDRLARLGDQVQVLVVTHSPQVAARGRQHWQVAKRVQGETTVTLVTPLDAAAREEELARMLAGAEVTREARAAARRLLMAGARGRPAAAAGAAGGDLFG